MGINLSHLIDASISMVFVRVILTVTVPSHSSTVAVIWSHATKPVEKEHVGIKEKAEVQHEFRKGKRI